jgi:mRNA-degrading endonuclease RelE of RelBE toxin-antitoxin system
MFEIEFAGPAREHLKALRKRDQQIVLDAVEAQLRHRPDQPTQNRKRLEDNRLAPWELRIGAFRVFYDVKQDEKLVSVLAVGQKEHNVLRIGGEEVQL